MRRYKVFLRLESTEALKKIRGNHRKRISDFIDQLADHPDSRGDYAERDEADRLIEIKVLAGYAVTFWADHPVEEIKIVDIRRADRP